MRRLTLPLVGVLLAGACGGASETAETTTSSTSAPAATTIAPATTVLDGAGAVSQAVDTLRDSGRYSFEAIIVLSVRDEPTEFEVEGWVDGADRELVLRGGGNEVITRVVDGVATVERNGVVTEVPLSEADEAPSIEILKSIEGAAFSATTEVTGMLSAAALGSSGFGVDGAADVIVRLGGELGLAGYSMIARNGTWTVDVDFFAFDGDIDA